MTRRRVVGAIVLAAVWIPLLVKGIRNLADGNDFTILLDASRLLLDGDDLYGDSSAYMYPPTFAFLLVPLAVLPNMVAGTLWILLKVPLFYYAVFVLLPANDATARVRPGLILLAPLAVYRFLESDLVNGNTNVVILAGIAALLHLVRSERERLGGAALALVSAIKLSPAYLILVTGVAGKLRAALAAAGVLAVLLVVPAVIAPGGFGGNFAGFRAMNAGVLDVADDESREGGGYLPGQSLRPLLHRYLRPIDATAHDRGKHVAINWASVDAGTVEGIYELTAMLLAVAGLAAVRHRSLRWAIAWGAILLLLISPYARKAHFLLLLPAYTLLFETVLIRDLAVWRRREIWACLAVSIACGQLTTPAIWGKANAALITAYGSVGLSAMAILPAMWIIRRHERTD